MTPKAGYLKGNIPEKRFLSSGPYTVSYTESSPIKNFRGLKAYRPELESFLQYGFSSADYFWSNRIYPTDLTASVVFMPKNDRFECSDDVTICNGIFQFHNQDWVQGIGFAATKSQFKFIVNGYEMGSGVGTVPENVWVHLAVTRDNASRNQDIPSNSIH